MGHRIPNSDLGEMKPPAGAPGQPAGQLSLFPELADREKVAWAASTGTTGREQPLTLIEVNGLDTQLTRQFSEKLRIEPALTRQVVSFQANKGRRVYRWYKYKEAFSASLVEYLLNRFGIVSGRILDPFAGMGTTLFAAGAVGLDADGIELLPVGQHIVRARLLLEKEFTDEDVATLQYWLTERPWERSEARLTLPSLRITNGAYPSATVNAIERFMGAWQSENERVRAALRLALICVLESVSYTRKDGQYLRWDHRSGRRQGARPFNKGRILDFNQAICAKIEEITLDVQAGGQRSGLFSASRGQGNVHLFPSSCLEELPGLPDECYDAIMTSPPYCNRYDYTRTYALELALLGLGEQEILDLRQQMLSCTVENRAKDLLAINPRWLSAIEAADHQLLLQAVLRHLESEQALGELNNNGIPRMVRGYFYEMACVIAECSRVLKPGAPLFMVNDNVRYAGASVSVDTILSALAENLGFRVQNILVLPNGKGNSSQQMGQHGREELRKCVYVWRRM